MGLEGRTCVSAHVRQYKTYKVQKPIRVALQLPDSSFLRMRESNFEKQILRCAQNDSEIKADLFG